MSNDLRDRLQQELGGTYSIEGELGGGGMSRVFVATENALGRRVVIKVLAGDVAESMSADRFAREVRLAAGLQHANIVPLLSAGTASELPYYTMPYVKGHSLRHRMTPGKPWPVAEALVILRDVLRAISFAHSEGVVHRDIKPENILLSGDAALVADFGIAKAVSAAVSGTSTDPAVLTRLGMSLGTPAYMSPEQATADAVDARTDIYAWGMIAYELLAGTHPFGGKTTSRELITAHLTETPSVLSHVRPEVDERLSALVMLCIAKNPDHRPASASEVLTALDALRTGDELLLPGVPRESSHAAGFRLPRRMRTLGIAAAVGVIVIAAGLWILGRVRTAQASAVTLAVLPFANLGRVEDEYFADGVADEVRGKLASVAGLAVIAGESSSRYKGTTKPLEEVAGELGATYLLVGKVRWYRDTSGTSRIRLNTELLDASRQRAVVKWQKPFDAQLTNVFDVQAQVAGEVLDAMNLTLSRKQQVTLSGAPTKSLAAYDEFLRGNEATFDFASFTPVRLNRAIEHYSRAVSTDSSFAAAWAALARAYAILLRQTGRTSEQLKEAGDAALRAVQLGPELPAAHLALGLYYAYGLTRPERALQQFDAGLRIAPNDAQLLLSAGQTRMEQDDLERSIDLLRRARAINPLDAAAARFLARALTLARRYPKALRVCDDMFRLNPRVADVHHCRAMAHLSAGNLPRARAALRQGAEVVGFQEMAVRAAVSFDIYWALDAELQQAVLAAEVEEFGEPFTRGLAVAGLLHANGATQRAKASIDSTLSIGEENVRGLPDDAEQWSLLGVAYALSGKREQAIAAGQRGLTLAMQTSSTLLQSYNIHQLARTYAILGMKNEAVEQLSTLVRRRYFVTPGWLRVDPSWNALRDHAGFRRLVAAEKTR